MKDFSIFSGIDDKHYNWCRLLDKLLLRVKWQAEGKSDYVKEIEDLKYQMEKKD